MIYKILILIDFKIIKLKLGTLEKYIYLLNLY